MSRPPSKPTVTESQWAEIRLNYEFDLDEPSLQTSINRAVDRLGFVAPTRMAAWKRANRPDDPWIRRGNLNSINAAAQRKADRLVASDGTPISPPPPPPEPPKPKAKAKDLVADYALEVRLEAEDKRAEVLARHRQEWRQIAALRQEAVKIRNDDMSQALDRARLAKTAAEITAIQQAGERKAWGMDDVQIPDLAKKSDAELKAILDGKGVY